MTTTPCAPHHQFVWPAHKHGGAFWYSAPAGLRCECGRVVFDENKNADGEPQGEPTGCNALRVGSIAGTPANENAEGWPYQDAASLVQILSAAWDATVGPGDDDVELDSPSWHNDALAELESRNFERVNMPKRLRTNDARRSG